MDHKLIIIVPVYNAQAYIRKSLESILAQTYQNYEVCVMDDCSTDNTWRIIGEVQNRHKGRMNLCRNEYRIGSALANFVKAVELFSFDVEDILVTVDGDDWLYDNSVFEYVNSVYQNPDIWMTYGQYVPASNSYPPYCKPIPDTRTYRRSKKWLASHLRTFKRKLFNKIKDADLRGLDGKYYPRIADCALLYPCIEMCGQAHMKFIEKILYVYNDLSSLNEMAIDGAGMRLLGNEIQSRPIYNELTKL